MSMAEAQSQNASHKRSDQGLHECEVWGPGEQDTDATWDRCDKNLGHPTFIPVKDLKQTHLTFVSKKQLVFDLIKAVAALTVRLRVFKVSDERPEGYPFANSEDRGMPHTGSGWVYRITPGDGPCQCGWCGGGAHAKTKWWMVEIFTACHAVYNAEEAQMTEVDFFYEDEDSKTNGELKIIRGIGVQDNNSSDDVCLLQCATHDVFLFESLIIHTRRFQWLKSSLAEGDLGSLCVVVSHPHGRAKHVTIGEIKDTATYDPEGSCLVEHMYTYSADTCFGSSGAPVLSAVSSLEAPPGGGPVWPGAGPHSWGNVIGRLNQCGAGAFYTQAECIDVDALQEFTRKLQQPEDDSDED